jgi:hypothetical protein
LRGIEQNLKKTKVDIDIMHKCNIIYLLISIFFLHSFWRVVTMHRYALVALVLLCSLSFGAANDPIITLKVDEQDIPRNMPVTGSVTVDSNAAPGTGLLTVDVYLRKADARGNAVGNPVAEYGFSVSRGVSTVYSIQPAIGFTLDPGDYVVSAVAKMDGVQCGVEKREKGNEYHVTISALYIKVLELNVVVTPGPRGFIVKMSPNGEVDTPDAPVAITVAPSVTGPKGLDKGQSKKIEYFSNLHAWFFQDLTVAVTAVALDGHKASVKATVTQAKDSANHELSKALP